MNTIPGKQKGASAIVTLIVLAILAYGIFIAIQYTPQLIESSALDSILESIESSQISDPARSVKAVEAKINNLLYVNQLMDQEDNFTVKQKGDTFLIDVKYERDLNLLYKNRTMKYEKSLILR